MSTSSANTAATRSMYNQLGAVGMKEWLIEYNIGDEASYAKTYVQPGDVVLDLGCGYGRIALPLSAHGATVYGLDISPVLIDAAKVESRAQHLEAQFTVGDMGSTLPYPSKHFNWVLCFWSSLCHVIDRGEQICCFKEVFRVLRHGGSAIFLVSNPEQEFWKSRLAKAKDRIVSLDIVDGHAVEVYVHSKETLEKLALEAGFVKHEINLKQIDTREWLELRLFKQ